MHLLNKTPNMPELQFLYCDLLEYFIDNIDIIRYFNRKFLKFVEVLRKALDVKKQFLLGKLTEEELKEGMNCIDNVFSYDHIDLCMILFDFSELNEDELIENINNLINFLEYCEGIDKGKIEEITLKYVESKYIDEGKL